MVSPKHWNVTTKNRDVGATHWGADTPTNNWGFDTCVDSGCKAFAKTTTEARLNWLGRWSWKMLEALGLWGAMGTFLELVEFLVLSSNMFWTYFTVPEKVPAPWSGDQAAIKTKLKEKTTKEKEKGAAESSLVEAPELGELEPCPVDQLSAEKAENCVSYNADFFSTCSYVIYICLVADRFLEHHSENKLKGTQGWLHQDAFAVSTPTTHWVWTIFHLPPTNRSLSSRCSQARQAKDALGTKLDELVTLKRHLHATGRLRLQHWRVAGVLMSWKMLRKHGIPSWWEVISEEWLVQNPLMSLTDRKWCCGPPYIDLKHLEKQLTVNRFSTTPVFLKASRINATFSWSASMRGAAVKNFIPWRW